MKSPTISIVIPTYNRALMVGRAIQSVLVQTWQDWELLVVDDGSDDNTEEVVRSYKDSRVRFVRMGENGGANRARNTGARLARGEFLSFLDSDSEWLPTKLERQMEIFTGNPRGLKSLGVVLTGRSRVDGGTKVSNAIKERPDCVGQVYELAFLRKLRGGYMSALVEKNAFFNAGLFDEELPACQDWDLCVRLAAVCEFDAVPEVLYISYQHCGARVHTRANTLEAYRILFDKYREGFSRHRGYHAHLRANLAAWCLAEDRKGEAFQEALTAIKLCPWRVRPYVYLALAGLGSKAYARVAGLKHYRLRSSRASLDG